MVLAKVLSQAGKWGWFAEVGMGYLDTGASTLRTKSVVFRGDLPHPIPVQVLEGIVSPSGMVSVLYVARPGGY